MNISIPVIRQILPELLAEELCSVQQMTNDVGKIFTMKTVTSCELETELPPKEGATRHVFGTGWERFYGGQWIPDELYWTLKIKGVKLP